MEGDVTSQFYDFHHTNKRDDDDKRSRADKWKLPYQRREVPSLVLASLVMEFRRRGSTVAWIAANGELRSAKNLYGKS
jgi:hypothetical protein